MAVIYIVLSLITAVIFFITRECTLTFKKRDIITLKIDFNLFAFELIDIKGRKKKAEKKTLSFYRNVHSRFLYLLDRSSVEIKRLCLPIFPAPTAPSEIPFLFANKAVGLSIIAYLKGKAKDLAVAPDATDYDTDADLYYHITLRAPLTTFLYTAFTIGIDLIKNKRKVKSYG